MNSSQEIKKIVQQKYAAIAQSDAGKDGCGCGPTASDCTDVSEDYEARAGYVAEADLALGCGIPTEFANIQPAATVLDLGSGAGNDIFVARALVGETGRVIGVDMTQEMIDKANRNLAQLGFQNVEFRLGEIEALPIEDNTIDVVISNCVLNLVPDKARAFRETYRVLRAGGHFCISDIVAVGELPASVRKSAELYAGCVAGAMERDAYLATIEAAGFEGVTIKKARKIDLGPGVLADVLTPAELERYQGTGMRLYSVTVYGVKPEA